MKIINQLRVTFFTGLMVLLIMNAKSQIPEPIAYYDFEGDSGDVVIDKSDQGNDAEVTRPGQTTLEIEGGAPAGASPATAANFQNGLLNVPGIGLGSIISGSGSYTFTAWLKPSDLNGDKFIFGQTSQGIHNGIRNNGFLHQAHWGADTNGSTNLNGYLEADEDGWIHAAWTYDGETDTGKIYLDGSLDWEGSKRAPNGSGNLIIGGRDGGGNGYFGLADDIAMWNMVLEPVSITELASGSSPIGSKSPFDFTSVIYNAEEDSFRFEWNSKPNRTYALYFSETLEEFDADVDDSIESGGETTVYPPIGEPGLENPLEGAPQLFFRIEENQ